MHAQLSIFDPITFVWFCIKVGTTLLPTSIRDIYRQSALSIWYGIYSVPTIRFPKSNSNAFLPGISSRGEGGWCMMNLHLANTIIDLINGKFMLFTFISLFFVFINLVGDGNLQCLLMAVNLPRCYYTTVLEYKILSEIICKYTYEMVLHRPTLTPRTFRIHNSFSLFWRHGREARFDLNNFILEYRTLMQIEMFLKGIYLWITLLGYVIVCDTCDSFDVYVFTYWLNILILCRTYIE